MRRCAGCTRLISRVSCAKGTLVCKFRFDGVKLTVNLLVPDPSPSTPTAPYGTGSLSKSVTLRISHRMQDMNDENELFSQGEAGLGKRYFSKHSIRVESRQFFSSVPEASVPKSRYGYPKTDLRRVAYQCLI